MHIILDEARDGDVEEAKLARHDDGAKLPGTEMTTNSFTQFKPYNSDEARASGEQDVVLRDDDEEAVSRWLSDRDANEPLCKAFPGHTMCKPKVGPKCKESVNGRGFSKKERKAMLKVSNNHRRKFAKGKVSGWPAAADMMQLTWSDELAEVAQRHADQCVFAHDKGKQRYVNLILCCRQDMGLGG